MGVNAHLTSYGKEKKFHDLNVEISHCLHSERYIEEWNPEAKAYERIKIRSYSGEVDITLYCQPEHLLAMQAAINDFMSHHAEYVERGDRDDWREDVSKHSRDFAPPEVEPIEKELAEVVE